MSGIRIVSLIGVPRTGSTRVMELLRAFSSLAVKGEMFHRWAMHGLEAEIGELGGLFGVDASDIRNRTLIAHVRSEPQTVIDWLLQRNGSRTLVIKLFADHLDIEQVKRLFARPDAAFVFVRRRPIDCYVSELKARKLGKWKLVDTTGVRVLGDVQQFIEQCRSQLEWYRFCRTLSATNRRPTADLSYDQQIAVPDGLARAALEAVFESFGVDPGTIDSGRTPTLKRQDRSQTYEERMINWNQFVGGLRAVPDHEVAFIE